jgi:hypothetical protein
MHLELQARCTLNHKQPNRLAANPGAVASKRKVCLPDCPQPGLAAPLAIEST